MDYTSKEVYNYISIQTNDPIIEWKTCTVSWQEFPIYQSDLDFYNKISPTFETNKDIGDKLIAKLPNYYSRTENGKLKVQIPTPTLCPEERQRRRLAFRNERKLYKRKCDYSGKDIISIYSPDKPYKVYDQKVWWSDEWDPIDYGINITLQSSVLSAFNDVIGPLPRMNLINEVDSLENSSYVNNTMTSKDCYMVMWWTASEWCMYCTTAYNDVDCIDSEKIYNSSNCYFCVQSRNCADSSYLMNCDGCSNSSYLMNCDNCKHCYACTGLTNKQYCYKNRQYSQIEYESMVKYDWLYTDDVILPATILLNSHHGYGNLIKYSDGVVCGYDVSDSLNVRYVLWVTNAKDCLDLSVRWDGTSLCYESKEIWVGAYHILFSYTCWANIGHILYSQLCQNSSHLFACVWLRNKEYCIFNKQYTKEQRHNFVPQIIARMIRDGERGEFFHPSLSPFGYNETVAQEYFPLTKDEALARGYKRSDYSADPVIPDNAQVLRAGEIPEEQWMKRRDDETILRQVIICSESWRPFMIQKAELAFYRKHNLPLPRKHPDVRHVERMALRPGRTLYLRECDQCGEEMLSVYPMEEKTTKSENDKTIDTANKQKVYCEKCYQQEVYS